MSKPLVSICIPVFNREKLIENVLSYACNQTYENIEILVSDNCSTDNTYQLCQGFAQKDSRISIHRNDINIGACANINRCVSLAKGEYIKYLLSDDILLPACTERMVDIFLQYPSVKLVACREDRIDYAGNLIKEQFGARTGLVSGRQTIKDNLYSAGYISNFIATPSGVLFKKVDFGKGFNPSLHWALDLEMWLRMLLEGGDYYRIDETLALARDHKGSSTTVVENTLVYIIHDLLRLKNQFADFMDEEGVPKTEWFTYVDQCIIDYLSNRMKNLTAEEVTSSTKRFINMVGQNKTEEMTAAMLAVIHYLSTILVKPLDELSEYKNEAAKYKDEALWYKSESQRLNETIQSMSKTLPWRLAHPFRLLKAKLMAK